MITKQFSEIQVGDVFTLNKTLDDPFVYNICLAKLSKKRLKCLAIEHDNSANIRIYTGSVMPFCMLELNKGGFTFKA